MMSLNVRTSNAGDKGNGNWDVRKAHMKSMLENHQPDFVGTQEASSSQYEYLKQIDGYSAIGDCSANERTFILFNQNNWELIENGDFALSDSPELGSNTWGLEYNREATWGRFRHKASGNTACVFNTHYDMSKGHPKSSVLVASKMAALCKEGDLALLTGDFNTELNSGALQYLMGKTQLEGKTNSFPMVSALDEAGETGGTFIGNGIFNTGISKTRFDFVFAKAENLCIQKGEVIDERFNGNNGISDHAQVMSTLCIGDGCSGCAGGSSYGYDQAKNDEDDEEDDSKTEETPAPETAAPTPEVTPEPTTEEPEPATTTPEPIPTEPIQLTPVVTPAATEPRSVNDETVASANSPTPSPTKPKRSDCAAK
uniref:Endonuclease/exonuclease/phosphatase domain-containing protein n=1 Tax=Globisporangium ultimum (strain ATCC 200006 / CBS 805.95 / DAOM BR144) TaxID=431595 RepID=K3WQV7_GLOUD